MAAASHHLQAVTAGRSWLHSETIDFFQAHTQLTMTSFALSAAPAAPAVGRTVLPRKPARINTILRRGTPFDAGQVRSSVYNLHAPFVPMLLVPAWISNNVLKDACRECEFFQAVRLILAITLMQVNDPEKTAKRKEEKVHPPPILPRPEYCETPVHGVSSSSVSFRGVRLDLTHCHLRIDVNAHENFAMRSCC